MHLRSPPVSFTDIIWYYKVFSITTDSQRQTGFDYNVIRRQARPPIAVWKTPRIKLGPTKSLGAVFLKDIVTII